MGPDAEAAILELDNAIDGVLGALRRCSQLVQEGKLEEQVVMLKFHELSAKLLTGGTPA